MGVSQPAGSVISPHLPSEYAGCSGEYWSPLGTAWRRPLVRQPKFIAVATFLILYILPFKLALTFTVLYNLADTSWNILNYKDY